MFFSGVVLTVTILAVIMSLSEIFKAEE